LIGASLLSFNLVNENLLTFKKKFSILSNSKIFLTISNISFQFLLYYYFNLFGLILGFLISQFLLLLFYFFKNSNVISRSNLKAIKKGIKRNNTIVKYLLPSSLINAIANNLMPILILTFFGAKEAGVYFFSLKILGTPLFLISSSVSNVFFQKSSELLNENKTELLKLTKKIVSINLILMLAFLIVVNTFGMAVFESIFNQKWNNLRPYSLLLSILILGRSAFSPISSLVVVLNKNLESLIFNIYLLIVNLIAIYIGYLYDDITITILILAIFGGAGYILLLAYFLNHLKTIVKK
jgi:O-antigen/teichoic acid export membrane protein